MDKHELSDISLFTGAMGLDLGLEEAGFQTKVAVECNSFAAQTIRNNRPSLPIIDKKIEIVTTQTILERAGLNVGEVTVVTGGPSCQPFSNAGSRRSVDHTQGKLYQEFIRVVREAQPRFFVMENVRGILSAAIKHRPLAERGPGHPQLQTDEELGSAFMRILEEFQSLGYYIVFDLVNAADFGVPQARERLVFIGSRDGEPVTIPKPMYSKDGANGLDPWVTLKQGLVGLQGKLHYKDFSEATKWYLSQIAPGGNWKNLPDDLKEKAIGKAFHSWGGRSGFLRRLHWDRPSPTLTTDPNGRATMLCHPDEARPLSIEEYALLQQFPVTWKFEGSISQRYIQVGNAVPLGLGKAIGQAIIKAMDGSARVDRLGKVECPNRLLIERQSKRPRTQLNPPRMRKLQDLKSAKSWLAGENRHRKAVLQFHADKDDKGELVFID